MLDRVAIAATPLRSVCALLLVLLCVRVDAIGSAIVVPAVPTRSAPIAEAPCTYRTLRTRAPGLHQRYLLRNLVARRPLLSLDD